MDRIMPFLWIAASLWLLDAMWQFHKEYRLRKNITRLDHEEIKEVIKYDANGRSLHDMVDDQQNKKASQHN